MLANVVWIDDVQDFLKFEIHKKFWEQINVLFPLEIAFTRVKGITHAFLVRPYEF